MLLHALILLVVTVTVLAGLQSQPRPLDRDAIALQQAHEWIENSDRAYSPIVSTHVWFYYFHAIPLTPENNWASPPSLETLPENVLVVWDSRYSDQWGLDYATLSSETAGWRKLAEFEDGTAAIFTRVSASSEPTNQN